MADVHSTGGVRPAKTLSYEDRYTSYPAARYFIGEPERPAYGRTVSESARQLAMNVRLLRVAHGWSQETLALNAGLDRTFVGAIERAERNITLASAEKIANAFGMTVADLLTPGDISKR
ncbi:hypothetical protein MNBD_GAMMA13-2171 [hydrothermal vent metagenome]|uniref:HTH cro/C1-type domain-containing protein n=1 Tax=hydrothermal vent metagenome TaxID=652676 RepID=A0A3B0YQU2_9ZZZZ